MQRSKVAKAMAAGLLCAIGLAACITVTIDDIGRLRKGMSVEEAKAVLPLPPKHVFPVETTLTTSRVEVCVYLLSSGSYASNYFLSFEDDKLTFWGYPQEFARSKDPLTNDIGEKAVATLKKLDSR
jgi:hypothetical protein